MRGKRVCLACKAARMERRKQDPKRKAWAAAHKKANREAINAVARAYRVGRDRTDERKRWNEIRRERTQQRRLLKPRKIQSLDERREKARLRYATPEGKASVLAALGRYWRSDKGRAYCSAKSAKRRASARIDATLTAAEWREILAEWHHRCAYCAVPFSAEVKATQDHVVPVSKGGHHTRENVVPACKPCNSRKGARDWQRPAKTAPAV